MTVFQRARSDEQREVRRRAILDVAARMLVEMPVSELALNELARRVGLAKSNVLRYFESREAVLLQLLHDSSQEWLTDLEQTLSAEVDPARAIGPRVDAVADLLARSLARRPVLCDLIGAQAAVLERNVSVPVATAYKRASLEDLAALTRLIRAVVPELDDGDDFRFAAALLLSSGAQATHTRPSAAMQAAYACDPALAVLRLDFTEALAEILAVFLSGLLARSTP